MTNDTNDGAAISEANEGNDEEEIESYPLIKRGRKNENVPPQPTLKIVCKACKLHDGVNDPKALSMGAFDKHEYWNGDPKSLKNACPASLTLHSLKDHTCANKKWFTDTFGSNYSDLTEEQMAEKAGWIDPRYDIWDWHFNNTRHTDWKKKREAAQKERDEKRLAEAEKVGEENGYKMVDQEGYKEFLEWKQAQAKNAQKDKSEEKSDNGKDDGNEEEGQEGGKNGDDESNDKEENNASKPSSRKRGAESSKGGQSKKVRKGGK